MGKVTLSVRRLSASSRRGILELGQFRWLCALGRSGISARKREGDGATPRGTYRVIRAYYRPDKFFRIRCSLPQQPIRPHDGWCDAPTDRNYNRQIRLPYSASAEHLWRADGLYDAVLAIDYNLSPRLRGRGSAIFLHVAKAGYEPTEGCVAVAKRDLRLLMSRLPKGAKLVIR